MTRKKPEDIHITIPPGGYVTVELNLYRKHNANGMMIRVNDIESAEKNLSLEEAIQLRDALNTCIDILETS